MTNELAELANTLRESVARGLEHLASARMLALGKRFWLHGARADRLLRHWANAARAGRLDWAIVPNC